MHLLPQLNDLNLSSIDKCKQIVVNLPLNKANGYDQICGELIKPDSEKLLFLIRDLFNSSLKTGCIPVHRFDAFSRSP